MENFEGVVLSHRPAGERGQFAQILTEDSALREVYVRGRKNTASSTSAVQQFSYAKFSVEQKGDRLYLNSVEPIRIFYGLRESLSKLGLASYFSELARMTAPTFQSPEENCQVFRLLLNCLHYLEKDLRSETFLKPVYELRLLAELGFMPDLTGCGGCGEDTPEQLYFSPEQGCFFCMHCGRPAGEPVVLSAPSLRAMRYITTVDMTRLFQFRLGKTHLEQLGVATERMIRYHIAPYCRTLDFYHQVTKSHLDTPKPSTGGNHGSE